MGVNKILCTVPSTAVPRSAFLRHDINKIASFEFWEGDSLMPKEVLIEKIQHFDALLTDPFHEVDNEVIGATDGALKIIADIGVGYDNIDIDLATKNGIPVCNNPHLIQDNVADMTFALMLAVAKNVFKGNQYVKKGNWVPGVMTHHFIGHPNSLLGLDVFESNLFVVGLGEIGTEVCRRASGFRMEVTYYSRTRRPEIEKELGLKWVDTLEEGIQEAAFISVNAPLTKETRHMFSADQFDLMKPNAVLINTARGELVNTESLYEALVKNKIAGAGVDVIDPEPLSSDHPLLALDNFISTPHLGGHSVTLREKLVEGVLNTLEVYLTSGKLTNCVNF